MLNRILVLVAAAVIVLSAGCDTVSTVKNTVHYGSYVLHPNGLYTNTITRKIEGKIVTETLHGTWNLIKPKGGSPAEAIVQLADGTRIKLHQAPTGEMVPDNPPADPHDQGSWAVGLVPGGNSSTPDAPHTPPADSSDAEPTYGVTVGPSRGTRP